MVCILSMYSNSYAYRKGVRKSLATGDPPSIKIIVPNHSNTYLMIESQDPK